MAGSKPLNSEEVESLLDALASPRDRALFLTFCGTGLRNQELGRATVGDVLTGDRRIRDTMQVPASRTKGKRRARSVPLPARCQHSIAVWLGSHPAPHLTAPLFPSRKDNTKPLTARQIQRIIQGAATKAKIPGKITPHSARKFFGTRVYTLSDKDINAAAQALGHSSIAATPAYLDLTGDRLRTLSMSVFEDGTAPLLRLNSDPATTNQETGPSREFPAHATASKPKETPPWPNPASDPTANSYASSSSPNSETPKP